MARRDIKAVPVNGWVGPEDLDDIGEFYALVIGIDTYGPPDWRLTCAVRDAKGVAETLGNDYGFSEVAELYNEDATGYEIVRQLHELATRVTPRDSLLIFFAGHGTVIYETMSAWIPADGRPADPATFLPHVTVRELLRLDNMRARHILMVNDSCYSVRLLREAEPDPDVTPAYVRHALCTPSRQCLTSGGDHPVVDEGTQGHSVFTYFLLRELGDPPRDAFVPSDVMARLKRNVELNAPLVRGRRQIPVLGHLRESGGECDGEFVFVRRASQGVPRALDDHLESFAKDAPPPPPRRAMPDVAMASGEWPMFRGCPGRSGYTATQMPPPLTLEWQIRLGRGGITSSPVACQDRVCVASYESRAVLVFSYHGELVHEFPSLGVFDCLGRSAGRTIDLTRSDHLGPSDDSPHIRSTPAMGSGAIFYGDYAGNLYAVDASSGTLLWRTDLGGAPIRSSPLLHENVLYVSCFNGSLNAVDALHGEILWTQRIHDDKTGFCNSSPALCGRHVFVGSEVGRLYAFDAESGEREWAFDTHKSAMSGLLKMIGIGNSPRRSGGAIYSAPATDGDRIYFICDDSFMYALCSDSGRLAWSFEAPKRNPHAKELESPLVADGLVFYPASNCTVYALDCQQGHVRWQFEADFSPSSPVMCGEFVYLLSRYGTLYCLDHRTGSVLWTHATKHGAPDGSRAFEAQREQAAGGIEMSPAVCGGSLYVVAKGGWLCKFVVNRGSEVPMPARSRGQLRESRVQIPLDRQKPKSRAADGHVTRDTGTRGKPNRVLVLPPGLRSPTGKTDKHRNPVRQGMNPETGLPLEVDVPELSLPLVLCPAGEFMMGSSKGDLDTFDNETPQHRVVITGPFYIGKYEVTQEEYEEVTGRNPSCVVGARNPVVNVTWHDAMEFCTKLSRLTGLSIALPSEAQWEYACRAGSSDKWCFGSNERELDSHAWHRENSGDRAHPVGKKKPNDWGLYDVHGNVDEWCADGAHTYTDGIVTDPRGPEDARRAVRGGFLAFMKERELQAAGGPPGGWRAVRGGSILSPLNRCLRCAYRSDDAAIEAGSSRGFRVCLALTS